VKHFKKILIYQLQLTFWLRNEAVQKRVWSYADWWLSGWLFNWRN